MTTKLKKTQIFLTDLLTELRTNTFLFQKDLDSFKQSSSTKNYTSNQENLGKFDSCITELLSMIPDVEKATDSDTIIKKVFDKISDLIDISQTIRTPMGFINNNTNVEATPLNTALCQVIVIVGKKLQENIKNSFSQRVDLKNTAWTIGGTTPMKNDDKNQDKNNSDLLSLITDAEKFNENSEVMTTVYLKTLMGQLQKINEQLQDDNVTHRNEIPKDTRQTPEKDFFSLFAENLTFLLCAEENAEDNPQAGMDKGRG